MIILQAEVFKLLQYADEGGTFIVLGIVVYYMYIERKGFKATIAKLNSDRVEDLKEHHRNTQSLLEKVMVAVQDNKKITENTLPQFQSTIFAYLKDTMVKINEKIDKLDKLNR